MRGRVTFRRAEPEPATRPTSTLVPVVANQRDGAGRIAAATAGCALSFRSVFYIYPGFAVSGVWRPWPDFDAGCVMGFARCSSGHVRRFSEWDGGRGMFHKLLPSKLPALSRRFSKPAIFLTHKPTIICRYPSSTGREKCSFFLQVTCKAKLLSTCPQPNITYDLVRCRYYQQSLALRRAGHPCLPGCLFCPPAAPCGTNGKAALPLRSLDFPGQSVADGHLSFGGAGPGRA